MKLFGRNRESLQIKKARGIRGVVLHQDQSLAQFELQLELVTEDGEKLELHIPDHIAPGLIWSLKEAYEAIHPPINWRHNYQAEWGGGQS